MESGCNGMDRRGGEMKGLGGENVIGVSGNRNRDFIPFGAAGIEAGVR